MHDFTCDFDQDNINPQHEFTELNDRTKFEIYLERASLKLKFQ